MHSVSWSSPLGRVIVGLGVFTFAFWALAAATFFAWSPSGAVALAAASQLGSHRAHAPEAVETPDTEDDSCTAGCDASSEGFSYNTGSDDGDEPDFAWAVLDGNGSMTIDGGEADQVRVHAPHGQPLFWFRDGDEEFWVTDRAIVDEARRATARVTELGREMGKVGAEMGAPRALHHRFSRGIAIGHHPCAEEIPANHRPRRQVAGQRDVVGRSGHGKVNDSGTHASEARARGGERVREVFRQRRRPLVAGVRSDRAQS